MKYALAGALLMAAATASLAANPSVPDPKNLQTYQREMNPRAALDQARRDVGTGLEGPNLGDGWDGSQASRTAMAAGNRYADQDAHTPFNGYKGEM